MSFRPAYVASDRPPALPRVATLSHCCAFGRAAAGSKREPRLGRRAQGGFSGETVGSAQSANALRDRSLRSAAELPADPCGGSLTARPAHETFFVVRGQFTASRKERS